MTHPSSQTPLGLGFKIITAESAEIMLAHATASGDAKQYYHTYMHAFEEVPLGGVTILRDIFGNHDPMALTGIHLFGRTHDWVQRSKRGPCFAEPSIEVRIRERGPNEDDTASWVADRLERINLEFGRQFPEWVMRAVPSAIRLTVPAFSQEHGCIVQPRLLESIRHISPFEHACAAGDVLYGAICPRRSVRGVKMLIQEEEHTLHDEVKACRQRGDMPLDRQKFWTESLARRWFLGQAKFWRARKKLFLEIETAHLRERHGTALDQFSEGFDRTAALLDIEMPRMASLPFWDLLRELGKFDIPFVE